MNTIVIGVAGGTASGKTTVAEATARALGTDRCALIAHDAYYKDLPEAYHHDPATFNFDEPDALDTDLLVHHLMDLRDGKPISLPTYDFTKHGRTGTTLVMPKPVILVEGILILTEAEVRANMDHRIFVDAPEHVRVARRLHRDQVERGRKTDDILEQYFTTVRPMHELHVEPSRRYASLVLDGRATVEDSVRMILHLLA